VCGPSCTFQTTLPSASRSPLAGPETLSSRTVSVPRVPATGTLEVSTVSSLSWLIHVSPGWSAGRLCEVQSCSSRPVATEKTCTTRLPAAVTVVTASARPDLDIAASTAIRAASPCTGCGLTGKRMRRAGVAVPGASFTSYQLTVPVAFARESPLPWIDAVGYVTTGKANVRSSSAAVMSMKKLVKPLRTGNVRFASILPVTESPARIRLDPLAAT